MSETATRHKTRQKRGRLAALTLATCCAAAAPMAGSAALAQEAGTALQGVAAGWRSMTGGKVEGALRLAELQPVNLDVAIGHFVMMVEGQGFYQGVYNIREGGQSAIGVFWTDGEPLDGPITGYVDIAAAPDGADLGARGVRITFLSGETLDGVEVR